MNSVSDRESSTLALDGVFTPPSREQWVSAAAAGADDAQSPTDTLAQMRTTTLEGIALEVLYDSAQSEVRVKTKAASSAAIDNRVSVTVHDAAIANTAVLNALSGGASSIELHVDSAAVLPSVLRGVKLDIASISIRSGDQYQPCAEELKKLAEQQNLSSNGITCYSNVDPIGNVLDHGGQQALVKSQLERMSEFVQTNQNSVNQTPTVLVDAAMHHNAGASTVEELHAALATAALYLETLTESGMGIQDAFAHISFQMAMDADVLLGVAKLRALNSLWLHVASSMDSSFDQNRTHSSYVVAETSHRYLSRLAPWNNHLRNLAASTAAMLGGVDALIVHPHDRLEHNQEGPQEGSDSQLGIRMARNVATILERESGLSHVHDPMAGSYAIENLTQELMQHTWQSLASTDTAEGWLDELFSGRWQTRLTQSHKLRLTLLQQEKKISVGVNRFTEGTETATNAAVRTNADSLLLPVRDSKSFEEATTGGQTT